MKVVQNNLNDFIKLTKDKQSFLLLVSEEELKVVKKVLEKNELTWQEEYGERRSRQRRTFYGRRKTTVERRKISGGRRDLLLGVFKERRSS